MGYTMLRPVRMYVPLPYSYWAITEVQQGIVAYFCRVPVVILLPSPRRFCCVGSITGTDMVSETSRKLFALIRHHIVPACGPVVTEFQLKHARSIPVEGTTVSNPRLFLFDPCWLLLMSPKPGYWPWCMYTYMCSELLFGECKLLCSALLICIYSHLQWALCNQQALGK